MEKEHILFILLPLSILVSWLLIQLLTIWKLNRRNANTALDIEELLVVIAIKLIVLKYRVKLIKLYIKKEEGKITDILLLTSLEDYLSDKTLSLYGELQVYEKDKSLSVSVSYMDENFVEELVLADNYKLVE